MTDPPPLTDLAIPRRDTRIVIDCHRCHRTIWAANADHRGWCPACRAAERIAEPVAKERK